MLAIRKTEKQARKEEERRQVKGNRANTIIARILATKKVRKQIAGLVVTKQARKKGSKWQESKQVSSKQVCILKECLQPGRQGIKQENGRKQASSKATKQSSISLQCLLLTKQECKE